MKGKIGVRLMASFATLFLIMAVAGSVGLLAIRQVQGRYAELAEHRVPARVQAADQVAQTAGEAFRLASAGGDRSASCLAAWNGSGLPPCGAWRP